MTKQLPPINGMKTVETGSLTTHKKWYYAFVENPNHQPHRTNIVDTLEEAEMDAFKLRMQGEHDIALFECYYVPHEGTKFNVVKIIAETRGWEK